jgi:hypothetical protein
MKVLLIQVVTNAPGMYVKLRINLVGYGVLRQRFSTTGAKDIDKSGELPFSNSH